MQCTQAMLEAGMICSGIYEAGKTELLNVPQPLKPLMFNKIEDKIARDAYESVNRVVNDLPFVCAVGHPKNIRVLNYEFVFNNF
jgi:hypothetical protein